MRGVLHGEGDLVLCACHGDTGDVLRIHARRLAALDVFGVADQLGDLKGERCHSARREIDERTRRLVRDDDDLLGKVALGPRDELAARLQVKAHELCTGE